MASFGSVVLSYGDSCIRESEMQILETGAWLNDILIGFSFEYLGNQVADDDICMLFVPAGLTQFVKLTKEVSEIPILLGGPPAENIQYAYFAVNDSVSVDVNEGEDGTHWSLLVFSRPDNKFLHFDSWRSGNNSQEAQNLYQKLVPYFSVTAEYYDVNTVHQQTNGCDCGFHVICNAYETKNFIKTKPLGDRTPKLLQNGLLRFPTATTVQATHMRQDLLEIIHNIKETGQSF